MRRRPTSLAAASVSDEHHGTTIRVVRPGGRLNRMDNVSASQQKVRQLRLVVEATEFAEAVAFYRDGLGLPVELDLESEGGAHVMILDAGRATLELSNPAQVAMIDDVEVGRRVAPALRVAFEVDDAAAVTADLVQAGADLIAPPTRTPWNSVNARLAAPAHLQITVFEEHIGAVDDEHAHDASVDEQHPSSS